MGVARVRVRVQWNALCAAHVCRYVRQLQTWTSTPTPTPKPEQTRLRAAESRCHIHTYTVAYIHT
jgi:hypothetical protein